MDTTVLLAHEIYEVAGHERIRAHFANGSGEGGKRYGLAPQVLQEFLHVVTDSRRFEHPLSMSNALARARAWWEAEEVIHCHPRDGAWEQAWIWMEEFRLGRKRILDSYLAATYLERGFRILATANPDDFAQFEVFTFESWALDS